MFAIVFFHNDLQSLSPCGLMDKALDFDTNGPQFKSQWELMVQITSVVLFDAQRGKEMVVLLLEYH